MKYYIGIDVSKAKLDLALSDDQGRILHEQQVANRYMAIKGLLKRWLKKYDLPKEDCLVCLEPTGHYPRLAVAYAAHSERRLMPSLKLRQRHCAYARQAQEHGSHACGR